MWVSSACHQGVIIISDEDLREYLPIKGDRVAVKAFAHTEQTETESDKRKLPLVANIRSRMKLARTPKPNHSSDMDDERSQKELKRTIQTY